MDMTTAGPRTLGIVRKATSPESFLKAYEPGRRNSWASPVGWAVPTILSDDWGDWWATAHPTPSQGV